MKVNIGKFHSWIGPYQICDMLRYVGVSEDRCHKLGVRLAETWVYDLCHWVESKRKRKVKIHIDKYDTWNMDSTLAMIILPMLKQLKETKHGSPGDMPSFQQTSNQSQCSFDFYGEGDTAAWEAGHAEWGVIMNQMIWTFEQLQPDYDWEDQYWKVHPKIDFSDDTEDDDEGTCRRLKWKVEGECDWDGMAKHQAKINAGLVAFGTNYRGLWD